MFHSSHVTGSKKVSEIFSGLFLWPIVVVPSLLLQPGNWDLMAGKVGRGGIYGAEATTATPPFQQQCQPEQQQRRERKSRNKKSVCGTYVYTCTACTTWLLLIIVLPLPFLPGMIRVPHQHRASPFMFHGPNLWPKLFPPQANPEEEEETAKFCAARFRL